MAKEIQLDHTTGRVSYVLIRNAVGQIYNGVGLETYLTANYATYDVAATEEGTASGLYVADMPALPAGLYNIVAKERIGGSPAESDPTVGLGEIEWDGSAVVPPGTLLVTERDNVATALLDLADAVESGISIRNFCRAVGAVVSGLISGAGTGVETFKGLGELAGGITRVTVEADVEGNRTVITLNL